MNPGHRANCPPDCELMPMCCYTCGWIGHHRAACPDHPANRRAMLFMTETDFNRLIPVGTYTHASRCA